MRLISYQFLKAFLTNLKVLKWEKVYLRARARVFRRMVMRVNASATSEKKAPTIPKYCMPGLVTIAPPTAVPKAIPMLKAIGSKEAARVTALGYVTRATLINIVTQGTESIYILRAINMIIAMAAGACAPTKKSTTSKIACTEKPTISAGSPKRDAHHPDIRLEIKHTQPYAIKVVEVAVTLSPKMSSR